MTSLPLLLTLTAALATAGSGPGAAELVARLADPMRSFQERCAAEDALAKLRPDVALPALLPHVAKGMPPGGIYNSAGREHDRNAPVAWQICYAVGRAWEHQIQQLPPDTGGKVLLALLKDVARGKERLPLLRALARRWDPAAEAELARLLGDAGESSELRQAAALALILHGTGDYRDRMLAWAEKAGPREKVQWYELLCDPRLKQRQGTDPRVVRLGFQLIEDEKARTPGYIHGAYFLSLHAGRYVGEEFAPDFRDPRYRSETGLREAYFADTVRNAQRWWDEHRKAFEKK